jgi:hypothetical protein
VQELVPIIAKKKAVVMRSKSCPRCPSSNKVSTRQYAHTAMKERTCLKSLRCLGRPDKYEVETKLSREYLKEVEIIMVS